MCTWRFVCVCCGRAATVEKTMAASVTFDLSPSMQEPQEGVISVIELKAINRRHALRKRFKLMPHQAGPQENFEYCSLPGGTATAHARTLRGADLVERAAASIENAHKLEAALDLSSDKSPEEQLRDALSKNAVRVIDVSAA